MRKQKKARIKLSELYPQYLEESKRSKEQNGKKYNYHHPAFNLL